MRIAGDIKRYFVAFFATVILDPYAGILITAREKSFDEFVSAISLNPTDFYLSANIKKLSKNEWQKIYSFFVKG